jgi:hypothetical protein
MLLTFPVARVILALVFGKYIRTASAKKTRTSWLLQTSSGEKRTKIASYPIFSS